MSPLIEFKNKNNDKHFIFILEIILFFQLTTYRFKIGSPPILSCPSWPSMKVYLEYE